MVLFKISLMFLFLSLSNQNIHKKKLRKYNLMKLDWKNVNDDILKDIHESLNDREAQNTTGSIADTNYSQSEIDTNLMEINSNLLKVLSHKTADSSFLKPIKEINAKDISKIVSIRGLDNRKPVKKQILCPLLWEAMLEKTYGRKIVFDLRNSTEHPIYGGLSALVTYPRPDSPVDNKMLQRKMCIIQRIELLANKIKSLREELKKIERNETEGMDTGIPCG